MITRRHAMRLVLALAVAGPASLVLTNGAKAEDATIKIANFTFTPAGLTIKPGTTVTWENADDIPHSVVEITAKFRSKPLDTGDKFTMTFNDPGEVAYYCGFHSHMTGKIIVKP